MLQLLPELEVQPSTILPNADPGIVFAMDCVCNNLGTFSELCSASGRSSMFIICSQEPLGSPWS